MATNTTNYQLVKPALTDSPPDITAMNPNWDTIDAELKKNADSAKVAQTYETAGGTGTAITIASLEFVNGVSRTFIASANNGGAATTLNGKPIYKPNTTTAPNIVAGKAYTVWYNVASGCFFLKASAEGNAVAANVLAGTTFSNDDDTGILGEMTDNGPAAANTVNLTSHNQEYTIAKGYHSGLRKIKAVITNLAASVIKAGTTVGGILGTFTSDANAVATDILAGVTAYVNGNKITGTMANRGKITQSLGINGSYTIPEGYHDGTGVVSQSVATKGAATITPGTASQVISAGQYLTGDQTIAGDADLISANIKAGKNIFGVAGNSNVVDTSAGTAVAGDILASKIAYVDGAKLTGTMTNRGAVTKTLTTQGSSYTVPKGYHSGSGKVTANFTNLSAANIKENVVVGGITGSLVIPVPYGTAWISRTSSFGTVHINSIAYGNGIWVAVGFDGKIATSSDSITWTQRTSGSSARLTCVAYGNGQFIAVGLSSTTLTSTDGITWTKRTGASGTINGIAYGNNLWVAVGQDGRLYTSSDGITWTSRTSGTSEDINSIAYGNGTWVGGANSRKGVKSTNGTTWTGISFTFGTSSNNMTTVYYGNGTWMLGTNASAVAISTDATNWTVKGVSSTVQYIYAMICVGSVWLIGGGSGLLASSSDNGATWVAQTNIFGDYTMRGIAYYNSRYIVVGYNGRLMTLN